MIERFICFLSNIKCNKINPIEYDKLLRSPGQSLDEEIEEILFNTYQSIFLITIVCTIAMLVTPWISILFLIILLYKTVSTIKKVQPLKLGRDGEKAVAQYLNTIARQTSKQYTNMYIFHDIINKNKKFNIDHIVLSKKGIFIIDTKTYSKDKGIKNSIRVFNKELYKNNIKIKTPNIKGQAKWLQTELRKKLGKNYYIIPIIAFIGWHIEGENKIDDLYITNAKTIKNILENSYSKIIFDDEELKRIQVILHELANDKQRNICCK